MDIAQIDKAKLEYKEYLDATVIRGGETDDNHNEKFGKLIRLRNEFMPDTLYRYRKIEVNSISAFQNDQMYFSTAANFNDIHDCFSRIDKAQVEKLKTAELEPEYVLAQVEQMKKSGIAPGFSPNLKHIMPIVENIINATDENMLSKIIRADNPNYNAVCQWVRNVIDQQHAWNISSDLHNTHIACFCNEFDSMAMWGYYAGDNKGFCLAYDAQELLSLSTGCVHCPTPCGKRHATNLYPVMYSDKRYDATPYEMETYKAALAGGVGYPPKNFITPDRLHHIKTYSTKGKSWAHENEWRLIYEPDPQCRTRPPHFESIRPKAVYFGCRMSEEQKRMLWQLSLRGSGESIKLYEMYVDENSIEYKLDFKEYNP